MAETLANERATLDEPSEFDRLVQLLAQRGLRLASARAAPELVFKSRFASLEAEWRLLPQPAEANYFLKPLETAEERIQTLRKLPFISPAPPTRANVKSTLFYSFRLGPRAGPKLELQFSYDGRGREVRLLGDDDGELRAWEAGVGRISRIHPALCRFAESLLDAAGREALLRASFEYEKVVYADWLRRCAGVFDALAANSD